MHTSERPADGLIAPILPVPDPMRTMDTYVRVFGFRRLRYFDGNDEYIVLDREGAQVHLMKGPRATPHHRHGTHVADLFIWMNRLEDVVEAAREAGLAITRGPESYATWPVATTEVVIEDHDGYWLCFATAH